MLNESMITNEKNDGIDLYAVFKEEIIDGEIKITPMFISDDSYVNHPMYTTIMIMLESMIPEDKKETVKFVACGLNAPALNIRDWYTEQIILLLKLVHGHVMKVVGVYDKSCDYIYDMKDILNEECTNPEVKYITKRMRGKIISE